MKQHNDTASTQPYLIRPRIYLGPDLIVGKIELLKATGSEAEQLGVYRHGRDDIRARIESELIQGAGGITPAPRGRDGA